MNTRFLHQATFYLLIFMIAVALISTFGKTNDLVRDVKYYPDFIELIENEDLQEVTIVGRKVEG